MRLIDADALISNKFKNDISYNSFVNLVKRQPTIEAEPAKTGKWIEDDDPLMPSHCSACGEYALEWVETRYCPWCGARMSEGSEE